MVLGTHFVVGGILGAVSRAHPVFSFCIGFISHFLLDAIPHWDYKLYSSTKQKEQDPLDGDMVLGKEFVRDLFSIGVDMCVGVGVLAFLFFNGHLGVHSLLSSVVWGAIGGVAPDFLQFAYMKIRREPLISLQRFHIFIHSGVRLSGRYILGPLLQIVVVLIVFYGAHGLSLIL